MAGLGVAGYHLSDKTMARALDPRGFGMGVLKSVDKRFIFNYGGGVKVPVSSHFGIRADIRHNFSDPPRYGLPKRSSNPAQVVLPIGGKMQSFDVSAGFFFFFFWEFVGKSYKKNNLEVLFSFGWVALFSVKNTAEKFPHFF